MLWLKIEGLSQLLNDIYFQGERFKFLIKSLALRLQKPFIIIQY